MRVWRQFACLFLAWLVAHPAGADVAAGGKEILNMESLYRWQVTHRPPVVESGSGRASGGRASTPGLIQGGRTAGWVHYADNLWSPAPPADWMRADVDDTTWSRNSLAGIEPQFFNWLFSPFRVSLRGKFLATGPAAVRELVLSMKYEGGVVVYLNGEEVARRDMPAGALDPEALANAYPDKAWVGDSGRPLATRNFRGSVAMPERLALRTRTLDAVTIPGRMLRRGVNVLAVEVRRAPYHATALSWFSRANASGAPWWSPIGISALSLRASGGDIEPNIGPPKRTQVWTSDPCNTITVFDYGDPTEGTLPVRIVGARNGGYGGQVVVTSPSALRGLKAQASALQGQGGTIPASNVAILYGVARSARKSPNWFDGLVAEPPASVAPDEESGLAVQPVYVRIDIPADARAGDYRGQLAVFTGSGSPVSVPVELKVLDWRVPDRRDFRSYVDLYESPRTLAMQYEVPMWSEQHWALVDKSYALLGRSGNRLLNIPAVEHTQFGNEHGFVLWIRKPNGAYEYDFTVFDRLLDLAVKHCGKLDHVVMQIWHAGGWSSRPVDTKCEVSVLDRRTGSITPMQVPVFGTPESKAFWRPFLSAVHERLEARGLADTLTLGILSDSTAPNEVFAQFNEIWPDGSGQARWMRGCHSQTRQLKPYVLNGGLVTLHEYCYGMIPPEPDGAYPPVWKNTTCPGVFYFRAGGDAGEFRTPLNAYRTYVERALVGGTKGIGRICLDYFKLDDINVEGLGKDSELYSSLPDDLKGHVGLLGKVDLYNLYPESTCAQRRPAITQMAWAGVDGPTTTVRLEALIEGVQDAEAVMFLSEAIDTNAGRLGRKMVDEIRALLRERWWYEEAAWRQYSDDASRRPHHNGRLELAGRLYTLAAEASSKVR